MCEKCNGMAIIDKTLADILIDEAITPYIESHYLKESITKAQQDTWVGQLIDKQSQQYADIIESMANKQIDASLKTLDQAKEYVIARGEYMDLIDAQLPHIMESHFSETAGVITGFYIEGLEHSYGARDIDNFFHDADFQALNAVKEYNFDLIRNVSEDMRMAIRQEVFEAKARGDSIPKLADNIAALGIEPIRNGYTGRLMTVKERATLIARTETARATMQGNVIAMQKQGVEWFIWADSQDERECGDCEEAAFKGPYSIDEIPEYPMHPGCRCDIAPAPLDMLPENATQGEGDIDNTGFMNLVNNEMEAVTNEAATAATGGQALEDMTPADVREALEQNRERNWINEKVSNETAIKNYEYARNNITEGSSSITTFKGDMPRQVISEDITYFNRDRLYNDFNIAKTSDRMLIVQDAEVTAANFRNPAFEGTEIGAQVYANIPEMMSYNANGDMYYMEFKPGNLAEDHLARANFSDTIQELYATKELELIERIATELDSLSMRGVERETEYMRLYTEKAPDIWRQVAIENPEYFEYHKVGNEEWGDTIARDIREQILARDAVTAEERLSLREEEAEQFKLKPEEGEVKKLYDAPISAEAVEQWEGSSLTNPNIITDAEGVKWYVKMVPEQQAFAEQSGKAITDAFQNPDFKSPDRIRIQSMEWVEIVDKELYDYLMENNQYFQEYEKNELRAVYSTDAGGYDFGDYHHWSDLFTGELNYLSDSALESATKDILIENTDGHPYNYKIDDDGRLLNIDDGLSFGESVGNPVRNEFINGKIEDDVLEGILTEENISRYVDEHFKESINWIQENINMKEIPVAHREFIEERLPQLNEIVHDYVRVNAKF